MLQHINDLMSNYLRAYEGDLSRTAEGLWAGSMNPSFQQIS